MVNKIHICEDGPELSKIALGFWRLAQWNMSEENLYKYINSSLELGLSTFDHADIYGGFTCEEIFGRVLKKYPSLREKIQLVTKCGIVFPNPNRPQYNFHYYDTSKQHIIESVDNSLQSLGTGYLDMILIHRPDPFINADETAKGLKDVIKSGKVKYAGVSNFHPHQFDLLQSRLDFPLVTNQIEFSVMFLNPLEDGSLDQSQRLKRSPMIWSPLAGGRLFTENTEQTTRLKKEFERLSSKYNDATIDQLALSWILVHPSNPVVVLGTGNYERLKSGAAAANINLSKEDWFRIWTASKGYEVP